jgi:hypothetical protein
MWWLLLRFPADRRFVQRLRQLRGCPSMTEWEREWFSFSLVFSASATCGAFILHATKEERRFIFIYFQWTGGVMEDRGSQDKSKEK